MWIFQKTTTREMIIVTKIGLVSRLKCTRTSSATGNIFPILTFSGVVSMIEQSSFDEPFFTLLSSLGSNTF